MYTRADAVRDRINSCSSESSSHPPPGGEKRKHAYVCAARDGDGDSAKETRKLETKCESSDTQGEKDRVREREIDSETE